MHFFIKMKTNTLLTILDNFREIDEKHPDCAVESSVISNRIKLNINTTINYLDKLTKYQFLTKFPQKFQNYDIYALNKGNIK